MIQSPPHLSRATLTDPGNLPPHLVTTYEHPTLLLATTPDLVATPRPYRHLQVLPMPPDLATILGFLLPPNLAGPAYDFVLGVPIMPT